VVLADPGEEPDPAEVIEKVALGVGEGHDHSAAPGFIARRGELVAGGGLMLTTASLFSSSHRVPGVSSGARARKSSALAKNSGAS
jgi:hypothetical protein